MHRSEKHIRHFNRLSGKQITSRRLRDFRDQLQRDFDGGRIDDHCPYGMECRQVLGRLNAAVKKMNGYRSVDALQVDKIPLKKNVAIIQTAQGPELIKGKKVTHYHHEDVTRLEGIKKRTKKKRKKTTPKQQRKISRVLREYKKDTLKSASGKKVVKRKQAVAIALRQAGVPKLPVKKKTADKGPEKPVKGLQGFVTADQAPRLEGLFTLPGPVGELLGEQQRYRLQIILDGEKFSSKSELAKQLADAFLSAGFSTGLVDYEQGGLASKDTLRAIERNVSEANRKKLVVSPPDFPRTVEALKNLAGKLDVVIVDSGSKIGAVTNEWLDELRLQYPDTIWVIIMQQNMKGSTRGGAAAGYNAPVVISTVRGDPMDPMKNYAVMEKNRGNLINQYYLIGPQKLTHERPGSTPDTKKPEKR